MSDDDQLGFPSHTKNENVVRDHPMIINVQFGFNQTWSYDKIFPFNSFQRRK
jgi:hypothetical protein